jgi:dienelactone hydrolase
VSRATTALAVVLVVSLGGAVAVSGQSLDAASEEALRAAWQMLTDPAARDAAITGDPRAATADRQAQAQALVRGSGGDVAKISEALERGRGDPAGFAALLSPSTLERLRALASQASDRRR